MKPDSLKDSTETAQGAVPFGYDTAPSSAGPEHHAAGATDPELPGGINPSGAGLSPVDPSPNEKNPPYNERPTWKAGGPPVAPLG